MTLKRGERVKVEFTHNDGTLKMYMGKFDGLADIGIVGESFGVVRLSKVASVMTSLNNIQKFVGRAAPGRK